MMQFDVVLHRLEHEFSAVASLQNLDYRVALRTDEAGSKLLSRTPGVEVFTRTGDDELLALFRDTWRVDRVKADVPDALLEPLLAGVGTD
jgi:peptide chain release factor 3